MKCIICNNEFNPYFKTQQTCLSKECKSKLKGLKILGHPNFNIEKKGCFRKGHHPWNFNLTKENDERVKKYSENLIGKNPYYMRKFIYNRKSFIGKNNPNWKDGISYIKRPKEFFEIRDKIRKRDNYICYLCFKPEENLNRHLNVHHIDYNKFNCSSSNLICLCDKCHGRTNGKRKYWTWYFGTVHRIFWDKNIEVINEH